MAQKKNKHHYRPRPSGADTLRRVWRMKGMATEQEEIVIARGESASWITWRYLSERDFSRQRVFKVYCRFTEFVDTPKDGCIERRKRDLFAWVMMPVDDSAELVLKYGLQVEA